MYLRRLVPQAGSVILKPRRANDVQVLQSRPHFHLEFLFVQRQEIKRKRGSIAMASAAVLILVAAAQAQQPGIPPGYIAR